MGRLLALASTISLLCWTASAAEPSGLAADAARLGHAVTEMRGLVRVQASDSARLGDLEARLGQLEEEIRRLTGRIEEMEYRLDRAGSAAQVEQPAPRQTSKLVEPPPAPTQEAAAPPPRSLVPSAPAADPSAEQGYVLGTLPSGSVGGGTSTAPAQTARVDSSGVRYEDGLSQLQAGRWAEAEQTFTRFIEANPKDQRAPTAAFWIGETQYQRKDYSTAAAVFAKNYRTYGDKAPRAADNLLKLGMSLAALGDAARACQTFAELAKRHPDASPAIKQTLVREQAANGCS
ncbi:MAG: tol-pal system protein YbgF [Geminicoccaceae bacterium]